MYPLTLKALGPRALITTSTPVKDALLRIRDRFSKVDPGQAVERLASRLRSVQLLGLYRELFPEEFAKSNASCEPGPKSVYTYTPFGQPIEDGPGHSERELEFLNLVNERLFNLPIDYIDMADQRLDEIMFDGPFNDWEDSEPDYYSPALQLAGSFVTDGGWITPQRTADLAAGRAEPDDRSERDDASAASDEPEPELAAVEIPDYARRQFWQNWEQLVKPLAPPLCYMDHAVNVMSHNTGVYEIDINCMCGHCGLELEWSIENVRMLAEQHQRGLRIFEEIELLNDWIRESPDEHVAEIVTLYNFAAYLTGLVELTRVPREVQLSLFANSF